MCASRSLPGATASSGPELSTFFISMTFLNPPEPRLITWNPPESVNVGPRPVHERAKPASGVENLWPPRL